MRNRAADLPVTQAFPAPRMRASARLKFGMRGSSMNEKAVQHGLDTGISGFFTWRTALGGLRNCNRFIASALRAPQKGKLPQNCKEPKCNCVELRVMFFSAVSSFAAVQCCGARSALAILQLPVRDARKKDFR